MRFLLIVVALVTWQGLVSASPPRKRDVKVDLFIEDGKGLDELQIDLGTIEQIEKLNQDAVVTIKEGEHGWSIVSATARSASSASSSGSGSGSGSGTGSGSGSGSGSGTGSGAGAGSGSGSGSGAGSGAGRGAGTGSGSGSGSGVGAGSGRGSGRGAGAGSGRGSGSGAGAGSGSGSGSGVGAGSGRGSGSGVGAGSGRGAGSGAGAGSGHGSGSGAGAGSGSGAGAGSGSGSGHGVGAGSGRGAGSGTGAGSGRGSAFLERPKADESNKDVGEPFKKWPCEDYSPELLDESASLPGISSGLKLKYSEDFGRHFVAAKDIKPGEILGVQKPYAKVICPEMFYRLCWHCAGQIRAGIPCRSCVYAVFCDEECRRNAWREYHDMECLILPLVQVQEVDHVFLMAFRLSILAMKEAGGIDGVKNVLRKIESCSDSLTKGFVKGILHPSEFSSICGLMQHADKRSPFAQFWWSFSSLFISILIVRSTEAMREYVIADIVCAVSREDFISVAALIFRNMQIAANNGYFVTSEKHGKTVNRYFAITPAFSLFNHSCHASAGLHDFKNKLAVYALTPIKAGDQVFINYGCDFLSHTRTERREKLKIEYCFNCKCIACENDWTSEDCQSYQKQELSLIGRATINEVLAGRDQMLRTIFNESLEGINFPFRISKLVDCIVHFNEHARAPCKELIELEKSLNRAFRFYGNRYESLE